MLMTKPDVHRSAVLHCVFLTILGYNSCLGNWRRLLPCCWNSSMHCSGPMYLVQFPACVHRAVAIQHAARVVCCSDSESSAGSLKRMNWSMSDNELNVKRPRVFSVRSLEKKTAVLSNPRGDLIIISSYIFISVLVVCWKGRSPVMFLVLSAGEHLLIAGINLHSDGRHLVRLGRKAIYQLSK